MIPFSSYRLPSRLILIGGRVINNFSLHIFHVYYFHYFIFMLWYCFSWCSTLFAGRRHFYRPPAVTTFDILFDYISFSLSWRYTISFSQIIYCRYLLSAAPHSFSATIIADSLSFPLGVESSLAARFYRMAARSHAFWPRPETKDEASRYLHRYLPLLELYDDDNAWRARLFSFHISRFSHHLL